MFAIFLFSGVILFQNFAASYTSYLSVVKEHTPFDSIQSLYEDTDFIIGTNNGTAYFEMFKVLPKIRLFYVHEFIYFQPTNNFSTLLTEERWKWSESFESALDNIRGGQYAFMQSTQAMLRKLGKWNFPQ